MIRRKTENKQKNTNVSYKRYAVMSHDRGIIRHQAKMEKKPKTVLMLEGRKIIPGNKSCERKEKHKRHRPPETS